MIVVEHLMSMRIITASADYHKNEKQIWARRRSTALVDGCFFFFTFDWSEQNNCINMIPCLSLSKWL